MLTVIFYYIFVHRIQKKCIFVRHLTHNRMVDKTKKLNILWTSDSKTTALNMLSTYVINSKTNGWWDKINLIIWGASAQLAAYDTQVQTEIMEMINSGVHIEACKDCADSLEISNKLEKLGIEIKYMGELLTKYIKSGEPIITI